MFSFFSAPDEAKSTKIQKNVASTFVRYEVNPSFKLHAKDMLEYADNDLTLGKIKLQNDTISQDYLAKHKATLYEGGYGIRGDNRNPLETNGWILPKCSNVETKPHLDVNKHRNNSDCSGFVSLSKHAVTAIMFGDTYYLNPKDQSYFLTIGKYNSGLILDEENPHREEQEISAVGPTQAVAFRKCMRMKQPKFFMCGDIFIRKDLDADTTQKMVDVLLRPAEKRNGCRPKKS